MRTHIKIIYISFVITCFFYAWLWYAVTPVVWTDFDNTSAAGNTLTKTWATGWNADAQSVSQICWDWYLEFDASSLDGSWNNRVMVWLNSDPSSSENYNTIDYAISYYRIGTSVTNKRIYVYEDGISRWQFGNRVDGDIFRIQRNGTQIQYIKNGVVFYTSMTTSSAPLYADTSMYEVWSSLWTSRIHADLCQKCGSWTIEWTETCDDGNLVSGDGCSDSCMIESWNYCIWIPSECSASVCSSGVQNIQEDVVYGISQKNVSVTSPDRVLGKADGLWWYLNAQDDSIDIKMSETIPAWMNFSVYAADQTTSFYYQWYGEVRVSSDNWLTYMMLGTFEPTTLYADFMPYTFSTPIDTTHVRIINKSYNVRRWWRMYISAVVADSYSCCGDGAITQWFEYCDDSNVIWWDGCSDSCEIEDSFTCIWEPSTCTWFCGVGEVYASHDDYIYWLSYTHIGVSSPNNALWVQNNNVAIIDGRQWNEITIEMSDTVAAGKKITTHMYMFNNWSNQYENDVRVYYSSDGWSTFVYLDRIIWTTTLSGYSVMLPVDTTHIKYIPTAIGTYSSIMYLDAVTADDYSCCGDSIQHATEQCDQWWETSTCTNVCTLPVCWDWIINGLEECDDSNDIAWDGCSDTCEVEYCRDDAPITDTSKNLAITSLSPSAISWTSSQPNSKVAICLEDTTGTRDIVYISTDASGGFSYIPNLWPYAGDRINVWVMLHDENGIDIDHHALILQK